MVDELLSDTRANGGLAPVDLDQFWADQQIAIRDPFGKQIPQAAFNAILTGECVFAELGIPEDYWSLETDPQWRARTFKLFNDKAEPIVGRRILNENQPDPSLQYPKPRRLHDLFEARNEWHGDSWWLHHSATTPQQLEALLDRVDGRNIREFILPDNWELEKRRLDALGIKPPRQRWVRGPVTFATSIYGSENLIYLILDEPELAARFRDTILRCIIEISQIMDEEAGHTPQTAPRGFHFNDDNCCLLNAEMYEFFGYPVLKAVFERFSPDRGDYRGQHSDSNMAHLLPLLGKLDLTYTNFGPTLSVAEIREHLPHAIIGGQLAPFTYSRDEQANMVAEFLRDFEQAREKRGLQFMTAGSVNNGSRLTGMRLLMAAVQRYGRY